MWPMWEEHGKGNEEAPWLNELEEIFKWIVSVVSTEDIVVTKENIKESIKKKKNWSAPGPDKIVNLTRIARMVL